MTALSVDAGVLTALESRITPTAPLPAELGLRIIGYGEISTVMTVESQPGLVLKRMAGFLDAQEVHSYQAEVSEYLALLSQRGITVVPTEVHAVSVEKRHLAYIVQEQLPVEAIGSHILVHGREEEVAQLIEAILTSLRSAFAKHSPSVLVGIDAQISNWAQVRTPSGQPEVCYLDVGTPLFRREGRLCRAPELALRSLPRPLAWFLRKALFDQVVGRYFDLREVLKDIAANFIKEGRADRISVTLTRLNRFLYEQSGGQAPLTEKEVASYYAEDKQIWALFQSLRRFDRFLTSKLLRKRYEYILPGPVKR